jgi:hypothetical protein
VPHDLARQFLETWETEKGRAPSGEFRDGALTLGRRWHGRGLDCGKFHATVAAFLGDDSRYTNGHDPRELAKRLDRYLDAAEPRATAPVVSDRTRRNAAAAREALEILARQESSHVD